MESEEKLAQPEEVMFERNVGHIARRRQEVEVWIRGIPEPRVGFVAGLDEKNIQLCLTESQTLSLIKRGDIVAFDETGNTLWTLSKEGVPDDSIQRIKEKIDHFTRRATWLYPTKKQ